MRVVTVATGAGSASYGAAGSTAASETAVQLADARLADRGLGEDPAAAAVRDVIAATIDIIGRAAAWAREALGSAGNALARDASDHLPTRATAAGLETGVQGGR